MPRRSTPRARPPPLSADRTDSLYVPLDFLLVRTPLLPIEAYQALSTPPPGDSTTAPEPPASPLAVGSALLQQPEVRRALAVGSSALMDAIERDERGALTPRDAARLRSRLLRYLIRMSSRPTPYGLFAGVALGAWGPGTDLALAGTPARPRTRPDMGWLLALVRQVEARPAVRQHLRLVANPAATLHAGRFVLAERAALAEADMAQGVSVRATGAVQRALTRARLPIPYADLAAYLLDTTPGATPAKVEVLLTELWQQTLLLTDLRPPVTTANPARYVAERLSEIPAASDVQVPLQALLDAAATWDTLPPGEGARAYRHLVAQAAQITPAPGKDDPFFQVDTALALQAGRLSQAVGMEAARAAELLLRISPVPQGIPYLAIYRQAFTARYGHTREVPLMELLDPQAGLGPPAWYASGMIIPQAKAMQRAQTLLHLACRALHQQERVVDLDETTLAALETWVPSPATAPPSLDIFVFVGASSPAALDAGEFQVIVGPNTGVPGAGRNLGRFADLLTPDGPLALDRAARAEEAGASDQLWAEFVHLPRRLRWANVVVRPPVRRYEIPWGVSPGVPAEQVIPLNELRVGIRANRFYIRWPAQNADLVITAGHMLNNLNAPAVGRFLLDVSRDGVVQLGSFDWGPAASFPFLPRVQVGRAVLRPAQWSIERATFPLESPVVFATGLARWRNDWQVPRHVWLSMGDNRLLLDLEDDRQVEELLADLRGVAAGGMVLLQEVLPALDQTWLTGPGGHFVTELVVPLVLRSTGLPGGAGNEAVRAATQPAVLEAADSGFAAGGAGGGDDRPLAGPARPDAPAAREAAPVDPVVRLRPPGSEWLFAKFYCPRTIEDDVIADPLRSFTAEALAAGWAEDWFFIRYSDPDPHVRLRFRGAPERLVGQLLPALCTWGAQLMAAGHCLRFSFDTYDREVERYGGPEGIEVAERIFAADSRLVASVLQLLQDRVLLLDRVTVAVLSVDDLLAGLGLSAADRLHWYQDVVTSRDAVGAEYRQRKAVLRGLLGDPRGLLAEPGGAALSQALAARREALAPVIGQLAALADRAALTQTSSALYSSFVHLHCNRLLGIEADKEGSVLGLLLRTREGLDRAPGVE